MAIEVRPHPLYSGFARSLLIFLVTFSYFTRPREERAYRQKACGAHGNICLLNILITEKTGGQCWLRKHARTSAEENFPRTSNCRTHTKGRTGYEAIFILEALSRKQCQYQVPYCYSYFAHADISIKIMGFHTKRPREENNLTLLAIIAMTSLEGFIKERLQKYYVWSSQISKLCHQSQSFVRKKVYQEAFHMPL